MKNDEWKQAVEEFQSELHASELVKDYRAADLRLFANEEIVSLAQEYALAQESLSETMRITPNDKQRINEKIKLLYEKQEELDKTQPVSDYYALRGELKKIGEIFEREILIKIK